MISLEPSQGRPLRQWCAFSHETHELLGERFAEPSLVISARHIAVIVSDDFGKTEN